MEPNSEMTKNSLNSSSISSNASTTQRLVQSRRSGTTPLASRRIFLRRPEGAVFGDQFYYHGGEIGYKASGGESAPDGRTKSEQNQTAESYRYRVTLLDAGPEMEIRICPNPECGAIFPPRNETPEQYCTDCGTFLKKGTRSDTEIGLELILMETRTPVPEVVVRAAAKGLSHGSVRAPLAAFVERLGPEPRHCLVFPAVQTLGLAQTSEMAPLLALHWGMYLGRGLDYLHDNGVHFGGEISLDWIGRVGGGSYPSERVVWADFSGCKHHPEGYVNNRIPDTQALANLVLSWLTPEAGSSLAEAIKAGSLSSGKGLARLFEGVISNGERSRHASAPVAAVLYSGRRSDVGMARNLNEDSLMAIEVERTQQSISRTVGVYVVADGMGGHAGGEVASGQIVNSFTRQAFQDLMPALAAETTDDLEPHYFAARWLKATVQMANREVFNLRKSAGNDMGSTLVATVILGNLALISHIGDSRAYLVKGNEIKRLTIDHSLVERMIASNQISREEARHHPQRNVIYRTIGDKPQIDVDVIQHVLAVNDHLLLCSDGLSGMVKDDEILRIVLSASSPQAACDQLVEAANAAGGEDNISVVLVKIAAI